MSKRHGDVWIAGLSGGGMLGEMAAKKLAKEGIVVHLIAEGSPELNDLTLELFDEATELPGLMGEVHKAAHRTQALDSDKKGMEEAIHEAINSAFHPDSTVIRLFSKEDAIVPEPSDPRAIEVGGKHPVIPFRKKGLGIKIATLAQTSQARRFNARSGYHASLDRRAA
jgi:hypothetical protein